MTNRQLFGYTGNILRVGVARKRQFVPRERHDLMGGAENRRVPQSEPRPAGIGSISEQGGRCQVVRWKGKPGRAGGKRIGSPTGLGPDVTRYHLLLGASARTRPA